MTPTTIPTPRCEPHDRPFQYGLCGLGCKAPGLDERRAAEIKRIREMAPSQAGRAADRHEARQRQRMTDGRLGYWQGARPVGRQSPNCTCDCHGCLSGRRHCGCNGCA